MKLVGHVSKMIVKATEPVSYTLPLGALRLDLNPLIGKKLSMRFTQEVLCISCGQRTKKSYQQGYCFPCTQKRAQCDLCIIIPQRCHYHLGTCRESDWGETHCMIPHVVYLAMTSDIKVGITRKSQIPTRWIDQGAVFALPLCEVKTRRISGIIEAALGKYLPDKTHWRKMLTTTHSSIDLDEIKKKVLSQIQDEIKLIQQQFGEDAIRLLEDVAPLQLTYPSIGFPEKIQAHSFDKTALIEGILLGIKGQYLLLDTGVLNIRKFTGYGLEVAIS